MNKYLIVDNAGKPLDIVYGLDITDAIEFCHQNEMDPLNIRDLGPVRTSSWAEVAA